MDEGKQLELLKKYGTTIMKMWDKDGASSDEIAKKLKLNSKDTKTLKGLMDESVELGEATKWKMGDGRPRGGSHIENIRFWDMPKDKLQYIIKDAGKAMKANPKARKATTGPGNWADQVNDAHTVLGWRKKNGIKESMSDAEMKKLGITNPLKGKKYPYQDEGKEMKEQTLLQRALNLAEAGGDPRIKKLSKEAKAILAMMANSLETTGGPWLDAKNVIYLTKKGVSDTLKKADKVKKLPSDAKKDLAILKKELGESVKLDPVDKDELKGKHKHRDDKDIDNDGDVDSSDKFLHKRRKAISKAVDETKGDGDEYKKFFRSALKKFGVTEPDQLEGDKKKKFYDYVDKNWKSDKEKAGVEEGAEMDIAKEKEKQARSQEKIRDLNTTLKKEKERKRKES
jgi:hypothetical protein